METSGPRGRGRKTHLLHVAAIVLPLPLVVAAMLSSLAFSFLFFSSRAASPRSVMYLMRCMILTYAVQVRYMHETNVYKAYGYTCSWWFVSGADSTLTTTSNRSGSRRRAGRMKVVAAAPNSRGPCLSMPLAIQHLVLAKPAQRSWTLTRRRDKHLFLHRASSDEEERSDPMQS